VDCGGERDGAAGGAARAFGARDAGEVAHAHGAGEEKPPTPGPGGWPWWMGPVALVVGLVLALAGALIVDIPAAAIGANISESHLPHGLVIADTAVQDIGFVVAALFVAQLGGRAVGAWQFGLRPARIVRAVSAPLVAGVLFLVFLAIWSAAVHAGKEKLLETLGTRESTVLLVSSALLTCVLAPICEEFLFRGFIFGALRNLRGTLPAALITGLLFGGVHVGSAPAADLVPLAVLGFLLCLVYAYSGSLYPCIALHALNNSIAFASLEEWSFGAGVALVLGVFALIVVLALALMRAGVIRPAPRSPPTGATAQSAYGGG
jgi:membrane protease YdiL (CAAX protease family)